MKRGKFLLATTLLLFLLLIIAVSAHPGRTDGAGGHTDHSTGEYHYHHGYPAHQHTNGECPYDYDDKTNHSSDNVSVKSEDKELRAFWWITIILAIAAAIAILIIKIIDNRTISELNSKIYHLKSEIDSLNDTIRSTKKEIAEAMKYANKSIYEITDIPDSIEIAVDGTPIIQDVYVTSYNAKTFHCNPHCRNYLLSPCKFYNASRLSPCSYCAPKELKEFSSWFPNYASRLNFLAKNNIPVKEQINYQNLSDVVKYYSQYIHRTEYPHIYYRP